MPDRTRSAASFDESPEERDQRRRERADKARPNVSMTPGQAETLAKSAAQDQREPPLCESKNCPNRAVGLVTDRNGVQWAACEKHAKDVLGDG